MADGASSSGHDVGGANASGKATGIFGKVKTFGLWFASLGVPILVSLKVWSALEAGALAAFPALGIVMLGATISVAAGTVLQRRQEKTTMAAQLNAVEQHVAQEVAQQRGAGGMPYVPQSQIAPVVPMPRHQVPGYAAGTPGARGR